MVHHVEGHLCQQSLPFQNLGHSRNGGGTWQSKLLLRPDSEFTVAPVGVLVLLPTDLELLDFCKPEALVNRHAAQSVEASTVHGGEILWLRCLKGGAGNLNSGVMID